MIRAASERLFNPAVMVVLRSPPPTLGVCVLPSPSRLVNSGTQSPNQLLHS